MAVLTSAAGPPKDIHQSVLTTYPLKNLAKAGEQCTDLHNGVRAWLLAA
jgi:hypothetical protein